MSSSWRVLTAFVLMGPLIGIGVVVLILIVPSVLVDTPWPTFRDMRDTLLFLLVFGYGLGLLPALAAGSAHILAVRRGLRASGIYGVVVGAGVATVLALNILGEPGRSWPRMIHIVSLQAMAATVAGFALSYWALRRGRAVGTRRD